MLAEEKRQSIVVERHGRAARLADRLVVRQALINLVDNAIKFSPRRRADPHPRAGDAERPIIDVIDSGRGIDAAVREHIFDRFYRAANVGRQPRRRARPVDCQGGGGGQRRPADARRIGRRRAARSGSRCRARPVRGGHGRARQVTSHKAQGTKQSSRAEQSRRRGPAKAGHFVTSVRASVWYVFRTSCARQCSVRSVRL